jgi:PAS domain S-box-containing protein
MKIKFEYKITLVYLLVAALWILFSDKLVYLFIPDSAKLTQMQTIKGLFYVVATAGLLLFLIRRHLKIIRRSQDELKTKNDEYYSLLEEYKALSEDLFITKEKTEENLQNFKVLLENAPHPIFIQAEGKFIYVNKSLCDLYGAKDETELMNQPVLERIHPDYRDFAIDRINKLNKERKTVPNAQYKHLKMDGTVIDAELMSVPIKYMDQQGALVFIRDITSVKKYIDEIKQKNQFIQTILDNLPIGIAINKFNEGDATYMNKRFSEIYGWPADELKNIGEFFQKVYPDKEYREKLTKQIMADINSGDPARMHWENIEITQESGEKRYINAVNIPLIDQNSMISTVMDITARKKFEKDLIYAKEKAEESNRLKTAFLNNISHEFRTPMNGIIGFIDLLLMDKTSKDQKEIYAQIIKESSKQFLNILTDIVEISQIQSKQTEPIFTEFKLNDIIQSILQDKKKDVEKKNLKLKINFPIDEKELFLKTDQHKLQRSLFHLIDNAIKFTHEGVVELNCSRDNGNIRITIKDTGIGIDPKDYQLIFEPFRQVEVDESRNYGGNGIGLSIVKSYIELIGGNLSLTSEKGRGTNILLTIPSN